MFLELERIYAAGKPRGGDESCNCRSVLLEKLNWRRRRWMSRGDCQKHDCIRWMNYPVDAGYLKEAEVVGMI